MKNENRNAMMNRVTVFLFMFVEGRLHSKRGLP